MKAVILAGGFGKRLKPLTDDRPKPMVEISGVPILEWQVNWLKNYNVKEIIICAGYLKGSVIDHIGSGQKFGVRVGFAVEEEPLGTGGALKNARALISGDSFIAMNGDVLTNLDPMKLTHLVKPEGDALCSIAAVPLRSPYGIIEIDNGRAKGFREKPTLSEYWINAGIYCLSTSVLDMLPDKGSLEEVTLPSLAMDNKIRVEKYIDVLWRSIDTHKDIEEAQKEFQALAPRRS
ncbi:MAG: nucleotidyltransferase family protein [archaeon]|jgi:mannose-1-phosphate guanylyltransferase|nr:nucleotidyltransferase family protein [archaeon]